MSLKQQIPEIEGVADTKVVVILRGMKNIIDGITGRRISPITSLGTNPSVSGIRNKINEIIARLQGDEKASGINDPTVNQTLSVGTATADAHAVRLDQITVPDPNVYTPTLTNVANLDASTAYQCLYLRVGSAVIVSGKVAVDPTLAATSTQLGISLPIASNLGANEDCCGTAFASGIAAQGAAILGDAANNRAQLQFVSADLTNQAMYFTFQYRII